MLLARISNRQIKIDQYGSCKELGEYGRLRCGPVDSKFPLAPGTEALKNAYVTVSKMRHKSS